MLPDFGCGMHDLVFAPNNETTISEVIHLAHEAFDGPRTAHRCAGRECGERAGGTDSIADSSGLSYPRQPRHWESGLSVLLEGETLAMPLEALLPKIDDRRYDDIVSEARARIPRYTSEWTDLNDGEPGWRWSSYWPG